MQPIVQWLDGLGLGQYGEAFIRADIDLGVLPDLTEADLAQLGVTLGHRKKLLRAIAALSQGQTSRPEPPPSPEPIAISGAERRQVTVMFCDLVGSTALSARLDPEDLREVIGRYHACAAQTVRRFNGFVAKYMGDGVLIYFGYPQAHEDDAEQAVRAGLALVDAVHEIHAPEPLQARIGIATGEVVVGDLIGTGSAQEQAIVGETPNLASRLQTLADPGTVVISDSTRRQIGSLFELRDLGPLSLKGFADAQHAWGVLAENRVLSRFEALRGAAMALVGREEELELLLRRWEQTKAGTGKMVLISGEPGIGKSRLTRALQDAIAGQAHMELRFFCSPHHQDSALHPHIAQLERAANFGREDTDEAKLGKLDAVLRGSNATAEAVTLIAELLSIPTDQRERIYQMTPRLRREKTLSALLAQLAGLAAQRPMFVIYEDIHWIDPSSRELLDRIIEQLDRLPVLLLTTFRPEFQPPWTGQPNVTSLTLTRLDRCETAALIAEVAGKDRLPAEIMQEIAERTDGVPLFIEEVTKAAIEAGAQARGEALSSMPHPKLAVPATLHASLIARLDHLGPGAKDIAQKGAAIGREFRYELIAAIADRPEDELQQALERLAGSGLLLARGAPPNSSYLFKHALVQDTAYSTLVRIARQRVHGRIAVLMEQKSSEIVHAEPALLAHHFTEAGLAEKSVAWWLKAGQQAIARSAITEAIVQLRKGLEVLSGLPDDLRRRQQELELQIALQSALIAAKGYSSPDVGKAMARSRALAELIDQPEHLLSTMVSQWACHVVRSEHKFALSLAEQIEKLADSRWTLQATGSPFVTFGQVRHYFHALSRFYIGEFVTARTLLEKCYALADSANHLPPEFPDTSEKAAGRKENIRQDAGLRDVWSRPGLPHDAYATMLTRLSLVLAYLGLLDQARSRLNEAFSEARQSKHGATLVPVLVCANWIGLITRSTTDLDAHVEEAIKLSTDHGFSFWLGWAIAERGRLLAAGGQANEGLESLKQGRVALVATGAVAGTPRLLIWQAETHGMLGQPIEGLKCLEEAAQIVAVTDEQLDEAESHRVRAELLNATGDRAAAEQSYQRALAVAQHQQAKLFELRAANSLARLWRDRGRIADAHDLLTPIYSWFTEGFDAPDLIEAKALLDELEVGCGGSPVTAMAGTHRT